jgi:hypothetical protein
MEGGCYRCETLLFARNVAGLCGDERAPHAGMNHTAVSLTVTAICLTIPSDANVDVDTNGHVTQCHVTAPGLDHQSVRFTGSALSVEVNAFLPTATGLSH